jgi:hypothetical protein
VDSGLYRELYELVRQAESEAEVGIVANIRRAIPEDPRLGLKFLERRHRSRWGGEKNGQKPGLAEEPRIDSANFADPQVREAMSKLVESVGAARELTGEEAKGRAG